MKYSNNTLSKYCDQVICEHSGEIGISPTYVANKVMEIIDPKHTTNSTVCLASDLGLKSVARSVLRKNFGTIKEPKNGNQGEMFPTLQAMYPVHRGANKDEYMPREHLTNDERYTVSTRYRLCAASFMKHADMLDAETKILEEQGFFDKEPVT